MLVAAGSMLTPNLRLLSLLGQGGMGSVWLAEFNATSDGAVLGTPLYMSPEQVLSTKDVTPASDLYSLGVVVYECLAGETPFSGETLGALHVAIANGRYVPISQVDPSLPPTLDAWFARAFSPIPTQRFATAQEMAETFLAAARGRPSRAPSPAVEVAPRESWVASASAPERQGAWLRVLPLVVGGLAVLALASGILLGLRAGSSRAPARTAAVVEVAVEPLDVGSAGAKANANANANADADAKANAGADAKARPTGAARPPKDRGF